jgi:hypothetical protein
MEYIWKGREIKVKKIVEVERGSIYIYIYICLQILAWQRSGRLGDREGSKMKMMKL